jgi:hypothetical protein
MKRMLSCTFVGSLLLSARAADGPAKPVASEPTVVVTVGADSGDIRGNDSRAIQKAIDLAVQKAPQGGGKVVIKKGTYTLYDSLHLRGPLTVQGEGAHTILKKAPPFVTVLTAPLSADAVEATVEAVGPIEPGWGVTLFQPGAWGASIRSVVAVNGNRITLNRPRSQELKYPLGNLPAGVKVQTSFPLVQILGVEGVTIEDLVLDGNLAENKDMSVEGCRNGGVYMCSATPGQQGGPGKHILRRCVVRNFAGDGISWQGPADVTLEEVESTGHLGSGFHPGTGAVRAVIRRCRSHHNGGAGIYVCWDVQQGRFEENLLEDNSGPGISTGHGDSDCLFVGNQIRRNLKEGVLFRRDSPPPAGCTFRENVIEDNGGAGVRLQSNVPRTVLEKNTIRDTRQEPTSRTQTIAITSPVAVTLTENTMEGEVKVPASPTPPPIK